MTEARSLQTRRRFTDARTGLRGVAIVVLALVSSLAAGCGSGKPTPDASSDRAPQEAVVRVGDIVMRASVLPTDTLGEAVAAQYGIDRNRGTVLLLVGVRRGTGADEQALPARVSASATDLLGKRQSIVLHHVRSGDYIDYAGTANVIAPDTLRFDIEARVDDSAPLSLQFNRDFFPQ